MHEPRFVEGEEQVIVVDEVERGGGQAAEQVDPARRTKAERRDGDRGDRTGLAFQVLRCVDKLKPQAMATRANAIRAAARFANGS